jgi:hypothetical protein
MIEAQRDEYTKYVAKTEINIGNARAFNTGDPVPASTVERFDMVALGLVVERDSEDGEAVAAQGTLVTDPDEFLRMDLAAQAMPDTGVTMGTPTVHVVPESTSDGASVPAAKTTRAKTTSTSAKDGE